VTNKLHRHEHKRTASTDSARLFALETAMARLTAANAALGLTVKECAKQMQTFGAFLAHIKKAEDQI